MRRAEGRTDGAEAAARSGEARQVRCYQCGELGHIASQCGRRACYACGLPGHQAAACPGQGRPATVAAAAPSGTTQIVELTAGRPVALPEPYMVGVDISAGNGRDLDRVGDAVVDSGLPISLIKGNHVPRELHSPLEDSKSQFCGINGSRLRVDGVFHGSVTIQNVCIKIKFYIVPGDTMAFNVLLGRDFLTSPSIRVIFGKTVEVVAVEEVDAASEIMAIEVVSDPDNLRDALQINAAIGEANTKEIRGAYESHYLKNLRVESHMPDFEMIIALKHEQPMSSRPRGLSFADREALRSVLDELLNEEIIRPSDSSYASPIVLAKKKDGNYRLCVDYRELNKITVRDNFPTELIDDNIDRLRDKIYFSILLDLKNGFHHVKMHADSVKYTSFVTSLRQFEYTRMPFGLTNAPRVFQRFIHSVFAPLIRENKILLYLDDILVATEGIDEHIAVLRQGFELAGRYHLRFRMNRCRFVQTEIEYYELRDGLVYQKDKNKKLLFYVSRSMENNVIRTCHDDLGHVGLDKVINCINKVYWFPHVRNKVKEHISNCLRCVEFSPTSGKAEGYLHSIPKESLPFATICASVTDVFYVFASIIPIYLVISHLRLSYLFIL